MLLRYYFGEDVFISYTRADAITYAAGLASELTRRDFSCFLDQWGTPPGRELPRPLRRALARSTALVLVGSEGATRSAAVEQEVRTFRKTGRTIIAIDFDGALPRAPWYELIAGLALAPESTDALRTGDPSPLVISRIEKTFQFTRRNQRARRSFAAAAVLLAALALASTYYGRQAANAADEARAQEAIAQKNLEAFRAQEVIARENADTAAARAREADEQRATAEERAAEAQRQQQLAELRQRVARARELASSAVAALDVDPELGVMLAAEAIAIDRNSDSEHALRRALLQSHHRATLRDTDEAIISPDSRLVVTSHSSGYAGGATGFDSWLRITDVATGRTVADLRADERTSLRLPEFSRDSHRIVAACGQADACVFDVGSQGQLARLRGHTKAIARARFEPDGTRIVTTGDDGTARVWNASTGQMVARLASVVENPHDSQFSPDGRYVLTSTSRQQAYVWDAETGRLVHMFPEGTTSWNIASIWSPDGAFVLALAHGHPARLWSTKTWEVVRELDAGYVTQAQFSRDGSRLMTIAAGSARIWETATGRALSRIGSLGINAGAFVGDGDVLITGNSDGTAQVWTYLGQSLAIMRGHTLDVTGVRVSADGRWAVTTAKDRTARVWDTAAGLADAVIAVPGRTKVWNAAFSPDGRLVVAATQDDTFLADARSGQVQRSLKAASGIVPGPVFTPNARRLITVDNRYAAHVWDTETGRETSQLVTHRNGLQQIAFTPDSRLAVSVDISGGAAVWETSTGKVLFAPGDPAAPSRASDATDVTAAAWSPNGSLLITQHDDWNDTLRVWDVAARRQVWSARGFKDGVRVTFSPDGRLFMAGVDRSTIQVWDVAQRRKIAELRATGEIEQAAFSGDSRAIVTRTDNRNTREVRQWDARSGRGFVVASFTGPAEAFSPDGRFALRRGTGNTVEVWEPAAGLRLAVLRGHTSSITGARFSADGRRIVTAGDDGTARIYECALCGSVEELAALARRRIAISGRTLSAEERFKYSFPAPR